MSLPQRKTVSSKDLVDRRQTPHAFMVGGVDHGGKRMCSWCDLPDNAIIHHTKDYEDEYDPSTDPEFSGWPARWQPEQKIIPTHVVVEAYLKSRRATLYGRTYDLHNSLELAVEFLTKEVDRINAIRNMAMATSSPIEVILERARKMEA